MSNNENSRWQGVTDRLAVERQEVEREMDRQQLLDELSSSRQENNKLEVALAKLAREQDRIALVERERVLKRAQIAQATAILVQEANWAKNRMESEMRMAKQRALMFPEQPVVGSMPPRPLRVGDYKQIENPFAAPSRIDPTVLPSLQPDDRHSGVSQVHLLREATRVFNEQNSIVQPPPATSELVVPPPRVSGRSTPHGSEKRGESTPVAAPTAGLLSGLPTVPDISSALSTTYTDVMSTFFNAPEEPVLAPPPRVTSVSSTPGSRSGRTTPPVRPVNPDQPVVPPAKADDHTTPFVRPVDSEHPDGPPAKADERKVPVSVTPVVAPTSNTSPVVNTADSVPESAPAIAIATALPPLAGKSVASMLPARPVKAETAKKKVVRSTVKGDWTNAELQIEAQATLAQLLLTRDEELLAKPALMARMFALPAPVTRAASPSEDPVTEEWVSVVEEWLKAVLPLDQSKSTTKKVKDGGRIDSIIASSMGMDPNFSVNPPEADEQRPPTIPDGGQSGGAPVQSDQRQPGVSQDVAPPGIPGKKGKDKNCVVM